MPAPENFERSDISERGSASDQAVGSLRGYTPMQTLFLMRVQGLINKRQQTVGLIDVKDWRIRLLDKALYSTYQDCVELGVGDEAGRLLKKMRTALSS